MKSKRAERYNRKRTLKLYASKMLFIVLVFTVIILGRCKELSIHHSHAGSDLSHGHILICGEDLDSETDIEWVDWASGHRIHGVKYVIDACNIAACLQQQPLVPSQMTVMCAAKQKVDGEFQVLATSRTFNFTCGQTYWTQQCGTPKCQSSVALVASVTLVGVFVVIATLIVILCVLYRKRQDRKDNAVAEIDLDDHYSIIEPVMDDGTNESEQSAERHLAIDKELPRLVVTRVNKGGRIVEVVEFLPSTADQDNSDTEPTYQKMDKKTLEPQRREKYDVYIKLIDQMSAKKGMLRKSVIGLGRHNEI